MKEKLERGNNSLPVENEALTMLNDNERRSSDNVEDSEWQSSGDVSDNEGRSFDDVDKLKKYIYLSLGKR